MSAIKALSSTLRVVEWDELPESVRDIPASFNPLAEGVLMAHQGQFVGIQKSLKVCAKGRRTGITFAVALDKTITAGSRKSAGGTNVFYVGDTKEKGLEFVGYCATFARVIAQAQGQGVSDIEEFLFEDQDADGKTRHITSYRIRFASGRQITALSSRPANIRGLQGDVVIDEAAFHADVQGVLDAATALLIWGGSIIVISTHNGTRNAFNSLVKEIEAGQYGDDAVVYTVTFDDAVANGLYERVCLMKGWEPTPEGKRKWYARIRNLYGPRKSAMREELDAIPKDGGGRSIPGVWIDNAMPEERPVLRLSLNSDFAHQSEEDRRRFVEDWIERELDPVMKATLDPNKKTVFGNDYARWRDFAVITPMQIDSTGRGDVPFIIEMHNVPTRQQEQILWHFIDHLPNFRGGAMDATGPGQIIAEYTADKYGRPLIAEVSLSRAWYGIFFKKLIGAFEDGSITVPKDESIGDDLRAVEDIDGISMVSTVRVKDIKEPELFRHGDSAIALVLAWYAKIHQSIPFKFHRVGGQQLADDDDRTFKRGANWRGRQGIW